MTYDDCLTPLPDDQFTKLDSTGKALGVKLNVKSGQLTKQICLKCTNLF